jgi:hypothetical protein
MKNLKARRFNLKNKLTTRRSILGNRFARRKFLNRIGRSNYKFPIALSPTIWRDPLYDNQNLNIQVTDLLQNNPQFINLKNMYQYWKIDAVSLKAIPQPIEGTYPPTGWAYLLGDNDLTINYASIPRLPGAKLLPSNKTTTHYFKRVGRQHDFNWYNEGPNPQSNFDIRVRFSEVPNRAAFILQVKIFLTFSMLMDASSSAKKIDEETCNKYISNYEENKDILKIEENKKKKPLDVENKIKFESQPLDVVAEQVNDEVDSEDMSIDTTTKKEELKKEEPKKKATIEHVSYDEDLKTLKSLADAYVPALSGWFDMPGTDKFDPLTALFLTYPNLVLREVQRAKQGNPDGATQFYKYYLEFKKLYMTACR